MGKRNRYHDHPDPEYQRWGRTYPRFPGVAECQRLVESRKATGSWADIVVYELADNATNHLDELARAFRNENGDFRMYVLMALEIAALPDSVAFLEEVIHHNNPTFVSYARRALIEIDTRESRAALHRATTAE